MTRLLFLLLTATLWSTGCATYRIGPGQNSASTPGAEGLPPPADDSVAALARDLRALSPEVDTAEARALAVQALAYSLYLADSYRAVKPAFYHNILVNSGLRSRGLCYHWADDLANRLTQLGLRSLQIRRAVAHAGRLREHNVVVAVPAGQPLAQGLVLDAWKHGGLLSWTPVPKHRLTWELVPDSVWRVARP